MNHPGIHQEVTTSSPGKRGWPTLLVILLFAFAAFQEIYLHGRWRTNDILGWDIESYYHYLPAAFIQHDLRDLSYVEHVDSILHPDGSHSRFGIHRNKRTGHDVIKFPYGTALFELPLFLVTHAVVSVTGSYPADGYSLPYQLSVCASTVLFVCFGSWLLACFLRGYVRERDVFIAIVTIGFGTNLFFYSTLNAGMSHGYLFFLFSAILLLTQRWHAQQLAATAALLGVAMGLTLVVRPVDGLVAIVPLLWRSSGKDGQRNTISLMRSRPRQAILMLAGLLLVGLPQLLYWKWTTGELIHYSYGEEGFNFGTPHIIDGILSYRKGWLIYSPLVSLGLIGLLLMLCDRATRHLAVPVLVFLAIFIYLVFSWWQWWYGGGFGCRPLVSSLALLALPVAILSQWLFRRHWLLGVSLIVVISAGIKLNMEQQNQYRKTIIHWDSMNKERYWKAVDRL